MLQVVQHWLSLDRKDKDPIIVRSTRPNVSAVPISCWSLREFPERCWSSVYIRILKEWALIIVKERLSNSIDELASETAGKQAISFLLPYQKTGPRLGEVFPSTGVLNCLDFN